MEGKSFLIHNPDRKNSKFVPPANSKGTTLLAIGMSTEKLNDSFSLSTNLTEEEGCSMA